jgi:hypothetical protein
MGLEGKKKTYSKSERTAKYSYGRWVLSVVPCTTLRVYWWQAQAQCLGCTGFIFGS